jgi:NAD(P)-dependent dehydrogenase (short-subunit alcohol dehydrogenase family)
MSVERVWLVTGCGSGLGLELARTLARDTTDQAVVTARDATIPESAVAGAGDRIRCHSLDITDRGAVAAAVDYTIRTFGRIDVLVNNAGVGQIGAIEELDEEEIARAMNTNFYGTLNVVRAVLPHMRRQRRGRLFALTSMGGFRGRPAVGIYNASKFAVEGLHEALAGELAPLGIDVTMIAPGLFRSDFRGRTMQFAKRVIDDYAESSGKARSSMTQDYPASAAQPSQIAAAIVALGQMGTKPPLRLQLGADAVSATREKLDAVTAELRKWEPVATLASEGGEGSVAVFREAIASVIGE